MAVFEEYRIFDSEFILTLRSMIRIRETIPIVPNVRVKFLMSSSDMIVLASHWTYMYE